MNVILFDSSLDGHHVEYASYVARHLLESGDVVTFVTSADPGNAPLLRALSSELRIHTLPFRGPLNDLQRVTRLTARHHELRQALRWVGSQRPDIFHHLFLDGFELAWLTALPRDERALGTFATLFGLRHGRVEGATLLDRRASLIALGRRTALRRALGRRHLDCVFVHSMRIKQALVQVLGPTIDPDSLILIPDPAPPTNAVSRIDARARLRLPLELPLLLFFGGLRHDKGPDLLLRALKSVGGAWRVVIAGEPQSFSVRDVQALVEALPVPSQVVLRLGVVPDADVDDYFASADAVILPYRRSFAGTSGVLMRATAAGRPVVATDVGDVGQIVRDHHLGLVVAPESSEALAAGIKSFLQQRDHITSLTTPRAEAYASENSVDIFARTIRGAYINCLQGEDRRI